MVVVARFLALLDLYRQGALRFDQVIALGDLQVSWIGSDEGEILATSEFDLPITEEFPEDEGLNPQVEIESQEDGEQNE
jgi:segregation and condensation protein A